MQASKFGYTDIVNCLLQAGADVNLKNDVSCSYANEEQN